MSNDFLQKDLEKIYSESFTDRDLGHLFFLGALAYPALKDKNHVINFVLSVLSEKSKALSEYFHRRDFLDKRLKGFEARKAKRNIEHVFNKRIPRRMQAVIITLNYINNWELNISKSVEHLIDKKYNPDFNDYIEDKSNIYRLIWTESKPVLHMAMALFPLIHRVIADDEKPSILSFSLLDELKQKKGNMETLEIPIRDFFILSNSVKKRLSIKDNLKDYLISQEWLPDVLKIAEAWSFILPGLISTIKKEDLYRIS